MYTPSSKILERYSKVLVDFALWSGEGVKKQDVVRLEYDSEAKPLAIEVYKRILENDAYPMVNINEDAFTKLFYEKAKDHQLEYFPKKYYKGLVDSIDHRIYLLADKDPLYLKNIPAEKFAKVNKARKLWRKWWEEKEDSGEFTWTIGLYGTKGMAREAGLSLDEYWNQIVRACYLSTANPIKKWKSVYSQMEAIRTKLNKLPIKRIHVTAKNTDLWIDIGKKRKWVGGSGRNIPSFELFTSPDCRWTKGHIFFDLPLYRYGNIIKKIYLEFDKGRVTKIKADKNQKLLEGIIKQKNADKIGEFSLTDKRFSKINKFMATTLYDENFGGKYGNMHIAVGSSYHDTYHGNSKLLKKQDWKALGYNESPDHCDIISTTPRTVEAVLQDGSNKIIYKNGLFLI